MMMKYFSLAVAGVAAQQAFPVVNNEWAPPSAIEVAQGPNPAPAMDPMMMMMLMGDGGKDMKSMLPFLMSSGGAPMDPMMMMMLMGDEKEGEDKAAIDPMMMMMMMNQGAQGGAPMDPMMMMMLMGDGNIDPMMMMMMNQDGAPMDPMMMMMLMDGKKDGEKKSAIDPMMLMMMNQGAAGGAPMDPMMMMMLMDGDKNMDSMLPLMMMNQQPGVDGAPAMDPMMMMMLMDGDKNMDSMLPLMMMNGGNGAPMDPMMMMTLLGDDKTCEIENEKLKALDTEDKEAIASGKKIWNGSEAVAADVAQDTNDFLQYIDYKFIQCNSGSSSSMDKLLPMMMMNGQGAGGMDPMMMMSLLDGGDMSDMLPLMMQQPGQAGAMNPMMMMQLLGDDKKSKDACNKKYKLDSAFESVEADGKFTLSAVTEAKDIQALVEAGTILADSDYAKCLSETDVQTAEKDSSKDMLMTMMMMNGGQMDPMSMMAFM